MTFMRQVGQNHVLVLDTQTDDSKVIDMVNGEVFITFNSSAKGMDRDGNTICHIKLNQDNNWVVENDFGIETQPVSFKKKEGIFDLEAEFAIKWLELVC